MIPSRTIVFCTGHDVVTFTYRMPYLLLSFTIHGDLRSCVQLAIIPPSCKMTWHFFLETGSVKSLAVAGFARPGGASGCYLVQLMGFLVIRLAFVIAHCPSYNLLLR